MQQKKIGQAQELVWLSVTLFAWALHGGCVATREAAEMRHSTRDWSQVLVVPHPNDTRYYDMRSWERISDPEFRISVWGFSEGLCVARREPRGKAGFIDAAGRVVIPFRYDEAYGFDNGRATVCIDGKKGVIDPSGQWVIKPGKYKDLGLYNEGLCAYVPDIQGATYWGFLDGSGEPVIDCVFQKACSQPLYFEEGRCLAKTRWDDLVYIDHKGRVRARFADPHPEWEAWPFSDGLARVNVAVDTRSEAEKKGPHIYFAPLLPRVGFINPEGKVVIQPCFTSTGDFTEGLAPASLTDEGTLHPGGEYMPDESQRESERRWGFIDKTGGWAIPMIYERVQHFQEGLAPFRRDGKWGYLDRDGKVVVSPRFDDAREFSRGVAKVIADGKIFFIDRLGHVILNTGLQNDDI